jgi:hypothetical protein
MFVIHWFFVNSYSKLDETEVPSSGDWLYFLQLFRDLQVWIDS